MLYELLEKRAKEVIREGDEVRAEWLGKRERRGGS